MPGGAALMAVKLELAEIFERHFDAYRARYGVGAHQWRAVQAIRQCRTAALGWHERVCDACGHTDYAYNSCHNRHCPKCQWAEQQAWVAARLERLPPVSLYPVVFTLPDTLNPLMHLNPRVLYEMLFHSAAETLQTFGRDPKRLGAELGILAVLHTWGQTLNYHVHLHCLVTAGGLTRTGTWRFPKSGDRFPPGTAAARQRRGRCVPSPSPVAGLPRQVPGETAPGVCRRAVAVRRGHRRPGAARGLCPVHRALVA
jgi:hypothetical protein